MKEEEEEVLLTVSDKGQRADAHAGAWKNLHPERAENSAECEQNEYWYPAFFSSRLNIISPCNSSS